MPILNKNFSLKEKILLSKHVRKVNDQLVHLVTKKTISVNSTEDELLKQNLFFEDQDEEAIKKVLFDFFLLDNSLSITIIPTWQCNLRCKHCFVLHKLVSKNDTFPDVQMICDFVQNYHKQYSISNLSVDFLGGESTIKAKECLDLIGLLDKLCNKLQINVTYQITTNGVLWNQNVAELLLKCSEIQLSIDGNEQSHNDQRKVVLDDNINCYRQVLLNLKRMVGLGLSERILVAAALYDKYYKQDFVREFFRDVLSCGIKREKIKIGCISPTKIKPQIDNKYKQFITNNFFNMPCCTYRLGQRYVIDGSNNIYCNYFDDQKKNALGSLAILPQDLIEKHKNAILNNMPILNDEKCKQCPVLGVCWGRCVDNCWEKPSDHCDQQALINVVNNCAKDGSLINKI